MRHRLLLLLSVFTACPSPRVRAVVETVEKPALPAPSITLSDWGLTRLEQIQYVSIGLLHFPEGDRLVVYDVRAEVPRVPDSGRRSSQAPVLENGVYLLTHFRDHHPNRTGGYFSSFSRLPSAAELDIRAAPDGRPALSLGYRQVPPGFSGFWVQLINFKLPPDQRVYLDASGVEFLTFSIRGETGNEQLMLQAADRAMELKEDSLPIGPVSEFLPAGAITTEWQQAWVPLHRLPSAVVRSELASLVWLAQPGEGRVFIRDLALTDRRTTLPTAKGPMSRSASAPLRKAMWLWETRAVATDPAQVAQLVSFCSAHGVTDVFLQLPYEATCREDSWQIAWEPDELRPLLRALHRAGVRVDALDGAPEFALRENHGRVLASIQAVGAYNQRVPEEERFAGIRYDIEPYLLRAFGGERKARLLSDYLLLIERGADEAHRQGMTFGMDIPFWLDGSDRFFEPTAQLEGRPLTELIIDRVDNLTLMDYRTHAYGPDGTIEHALGELHYAAAQGKPVLLGLETVALPDETLLEFTAAAAAGPQLVLTDLDRQRVRVELHPAPPPPGAPRVLGLSYRAQVLADKLTFHRRTPAQLEAVMRQTAVELTDLPSFRGFALHSYESYHPWTEGRKSTSAPIPVQRE